MNDQFYSTQRKTRLNPYYSNDELDLENHSNTEGFSKIENQQKLAIQHNPNEAIYQSNRKGSHECEDVEGLFDWRSGKKQKYAYSGVQSEKSESQETIRLNIAAADLTIQKTLCEPQNPKLLYQSKLPNQLKSPCRSDHSSVSTQKGGSTLTRHPLYNQKLSTVAGPTLTSYQSRVAFSRQLYNTTSNNQELFRSKDDRHVRNDKSDSSSSKTEIERYTDEDKTDNELLLQQQNQSLASQLFDAARCVTKRKKTAQAHHHPPQQEYKVFQEDLLDGISPISKYQMKQGDQTSLFGGLLSHRQGGGRFAEDEYDESSEQYYEKEQAPTGKHHTQFFKRAMTAKQNEQQRPPPLIDFSNIDQFEENDRLLAKNSNQLDTPQLGTANAEDPDQLLEQQNLISKKDEQLGVKELDFASEQREFIKNYKFFKNKLKTIPKTLFQKFKLCLRHKLYKMVDSVLLPRLISWLQTGIKATKFHYNVKNSKECTLKLSPDLNSLYWEYDDQKYSSQTMHRYFKIKQIISVLYGPQSYTFRAYRLQDLMDQFGEDKKENNEPKFYGWECVSVKIKARTYDFVIKDERNVMKLLQTLSVLIMLREKDHLNAEELQNPDYMGEISQKMRQIKNFKHIRTKMKISYHASAKKISVLEHFIRSMIKSYKVLYFDEVQKQMLECQKQGSGSSPEGKKKGGSPEGKKLSSFKVVPGATSKEKAFNILTMSTSGLNNDQFRGMIALGAFFAPKLRGLAKLKTMKARISYGRVKFERYLLSDWQFGVNPCSKIPLDLQIASYPQSFRYYDPVPLIFSRQLRVKAENAVKALQKLEEMKKISKQAEEESELIEEQSKSQNSQKQRRTFIQKYLPKCLSVPLERNIIEDNLQRQNEQWQLQKTEKELEEERQLEKIRNQASPKKLDKARSEKVRREIEKKFNINTRSFISRRDGVIPKSKLVDAFKGMLNDLQKQEEEQYDIVKFKLKQMHMKQLMSLKLKGRYLQETRLFELENHVVPSEMSQQRVKTQLNYQHEDLVEDVFSKVEKAQAMEKKNTIVNTQIESEYFFFNPVYKDLLDKRSVIMKASDDVHENLKVKQFLLTLPSLRMSVRYRARKAHRKMNNTDSPREYNGVSGVGAKGAI